LIKKIQKPIVLTGLTVILNHIKVDEINTSLDSPLPMTIPPKHISPHEVAYLINKSQKHKSPGYDLITSEVAADLPKKKILFLAFIYNSMIRLTYYGNTQ